MSTRRARIKAPVALPPRRKNADKADDKKKQVELKGESESGSKPEQGSQISLDNQNYVVKSSQEEKKEGFEDDITASRSRRLSVDKNAHENAKERFEEGITPSSSRRISGDKTPKERRSSVNKTPNRRFSLEKYAQEISMSVELTIEQALPKTKSNLKTSSDSGIELTKNSISNPQTLTASFPSIKSILQAHLEKSPKVSLEFSRGKEDGSCNKANNTHFASPRARASPTHRRSPIVRTPVIEVELTSEKWITPHKGPNSATFYDSSSKDNDGNKNQQAASDRGTDDEVDVVVEKLTDKDVKKLKDAIAGGSKKNDQVQILEEFVIEPITEKATVMDGIVPLQTVSKAPKPLDLLKNEIISENAEVLFDPIIPLPSPSKVRPKLRPVPRLYPLRRNSVQGSASESEDESRRALHGGAATPVGMRTRHDSHTTQSAIKRDSRVRNDSVCSVVSQAPSQTTATGSPQREKIREKSRREEQHSRRMAAMRRRQAQVEREKLTMYDLIFYNPKTNPIIPDQDEINAKEATKKEEAERKEATKQEGANIEAVSEPAAAVPQIKLGPNGEIVLDEQSLVVNQSQSRKLEASVVREGAWCGAGRSRAYRRSARTREWCDAETVMFYRALAALGTDFTLMQPLFPTRTRKDLKLKFKKEERNNLAQVDKALRSRADWDPERLETEFSEERRVAEENATKEKERLKLEKEMERERKQEMKQLRLKRSRSSKILGASAMPKTYSQGKLTPSTIDEYVTFQEERKKRLNPPRKKKQTHELVHGKVTAMNAVMVPTPAKPPSPTLATLTLLDRYKNNPSKRSIPRNDMATLTKEVAVPIVPPNIEKGSLVVLTVNDPQSPSRKMLQTYIAQGPGELAPVSLPPMFLNSVVGFMKKGSSPSIATSPVVARERSNTPKMSPRKRKSSYTITQL